MDDRVRLADGFEDAFMGIGSQFMSYFAIYDYGKCVQILMQRDGMTEEDAEEFMDFNVTGAWVGKGTPVFLRPMSLDDAVEWLAESGE
jgi:hypothetical protein